jgi:RNA polymerase sigma-70 factor (ECF subfamily)
MDDTSVSLLDRLQQVPDGEAWAQLLNVYEPLLRTWLRIYDVPDHDADDLVQDVLMALAKDLPSFDHSGRVGAFRAWLRTILLNRLRNYWRTCRNAPQPRGDSSAQQLLEQLADPGSALTERWNREHDQHVARHLLSLAQPQFSTKTWSAFSRVTLDAEPPEVVAAELGMTTNSVFVAKSRVLRRLRLIAEGLVDSSFVSRGQPL